MLWRWSLASQVSAGCLAVDDVVAVLGRKEEREGDEVCGEWAEDK